MPKTLKNNGTSQAVDDLLVVEEIFSKSEFRGFGVTSFDLIKNDRGGRSKTFLGLGELIGLISSRTTGPFPALYGAAILAFSQKVTQFSRDNITF